MLMLAQLGSFFLQLYLYLVPCRLSLIDRSASETCRQQGRFGTRGQGAWRPFLGYGELYLIARGNAVVFNEWPICRRAARQVCATPSGTRAATSTPDPIDAPIVYPESINSASAVLQGNPSRIQFVDALHHELGRRRALSRTTKTLTSSSRAQSGWTWRNAAGPNGGRAV